MREEGKEEEENGITGEKAAEGDGRRREDRGSAGGSARRLLRLTLPTPCLAHATSARIEFQIGALGRRRRASRVPRLPEPAVVSPAAQGGFAGAVAGRALLRRASRTRRPRP